MHEVFREEVQKSDEKLISGKSLNPEDVDVGSKNYQARGE